MKKEALWSIYLPFRGGKDGQLFFSGQEVAWPEMTIETAERLSQLDIAVVCDGDKQAATLLRDL